MNFIRELRLLKTKENETSIEMAKKLKIKVGDLSSSENGKVPIKKDLLNGLFGNYDLNNLEKEIFKKHATDHNKKLDIVSIDDKELSRKALEELGDIFFSNSERVQLGHRIKEIEGKILIHHACRVQEKEEEYQTKKTMEKLLEEMKKKYKELSQEE